MWKIVKEDVDYMINKDIRNFMSIFFCSTIIKYERRIKSPYPTLLLFSEFRVYLRLALSVNEVHKLLREE